MVRPPAFALAIAFASVLSACAAGTGSSGVPLPSSPDGVETVADAAAVAAHHATGSQNAAAAIAVADALGSRIKAAGDESDAIALGESGRHPNAGCVAGVEFFAPDRHGDPNSTETLRFYDRACHRLAVDAIRSYASGSAGAGDRERDGLVLHARPFECAGRRSDRNVADHRRELRQIRHAHRIVGLPPLNPKPAGGGRTEARPFRLRDAGRAEFDRDERLLSRCRWIRRRRHRIARCNVRMARRDASGTNRDAHRQRQRLHHVAIDAKRTRLPRRYRFALDRGQRAERELPDRVARVHTFGRYRDRNVIPFVDRDVLQRPAQRDRGRKGIARRRVLARRQNRRPYPEFRDSRKDRGKSADRFVRRQRLRQRRTNDHQYGVRNIRSSTGAWSAKRSARARCTCRTPPRASIRSVRTTLVLCVVHRGLQEHPRRADLARVGLRAFEELRRDTVTPEARIDEEIFENQRRARRTVENVGKSCTKPAAFPVSSYATKTTLVPVARRACIRTIVRPLRPAADGRKTRGRPRPAARALPSLRVRRARRPRHLTSVQGTARAPLNRAAHSCAARSGRRASAATGWLL